MAHLETTCERLVSLDTEFLEGVLDDDELVQFELHLTICPKCFRHLDHLRRTVTAVRSLLVDPLSHERLDELMTALGPSTSER